jgi:hypothetical protein
MMTSLEFLGILQRRLIRTFRTSKTKLASHQLEPLGQEGGVGRDTDGSVMSLYDIENPAATINIPSTDNSRLDWG